MDSAFLKDLNVRYALGSETCSRVPLANVDCGTMVPQVWWLPSEVWEIRGAGKLASLPKLIAKLKWDFQDITLS